MPIYNNEPIINGGASVSKMINLEKVINNIGGDINKLKNIASDHGALLRELFSSCNSAATKTELMTAVTSIR